MEDTSPQQPTHNLPTFSSHSGSPLTMRGLTHTYVDLLAHASIFHSHYPQIANSYLCPLFRHIGAHTVFVSPGRKTQLGREF